MGFSVKEKIIDDHTVKVANFGATRGHQLLVTLLRKFSPVLGKIVSVLDKLDILKLMQSEDDLLDKITISDLNLSAIGDALVELTSHLSDEEVDALMKRVLSSTTVDGTEVGKSTDLFDSVFTGNYALLYKTLGFALMANYSSFFSKGDIGSMIKRAKEVLPMSPENGKK